MKFKMNFYRGKTAILATMHSKENVITPLLKGGLGLQVEVTQNLNTNQFGTFTRTIKRQGTQLDAALAKAYTALKDSEFEIAIASEGSFGANTSFSLIPINIELILFLDPINNLVVKGLHKNHDLLLKGSYATSLEEALEIVKEFNFPDHGIVLRQNQNSRKILNENIQSTDELRSYLLKYFKRPFRKRIFIETDMRAHRNPARMKNISLATQDLVNKLKTNCPKCSHPGFGLNGYEYGLKCQLCGQPTSQKKAEIHYCSSCKYQEIKVIKPETKANPRYCNYCNP